MLGLASHGSSTEWPATEETGDATRAGGAAIFMRALFQLLKQVLCVQPPAVDVLIWFQSSQY